MKTLEQRIANLENVVGIGDYGEEVTEDEVLVNAASLINVESDRKVKIYYAHCECELEEGEEGVKMAIYPNDDGTARIVVTKTNN